MKLRKKTIFLLMCCLLALALLSGCGSGQQAAGYSSGSSEVSPPEQSVEETHPGEEPAQTEVPNPGTNEDGGEGAVSAAPQPPGISTEQTGEPVQPENETTTPDVESPMPETPGGTPEPSETTSGNTAIESTGSEEESAEMKMRVQIGESVFTATLEDNAAVDALVEMMENGPVTIQMSDYAGFEKVGVLGASLPTSNSKTTTQAGDIVLYQGNQIVLFYGSNSWSYTRLGKIVDLTGWAEALGSGDVSVTFSLRG